MKIFLTFLLTFHLLILHAQGATEIQIEKRTDTLLNKIKAGNISDVERNELKQIAYLVQNTGQSFAETYTDNKKALPWVDRAIFIFQALADTANEANNRKFKGYLLGALGKFAEAKAEVEAAIYLFGRKKNDDGIAVSEFDFSRVYEAEHNLDSAIYYCNTSLAHWKSINNISRIFNTQNMLINLLTKSKQYERAKIIQKGSEENIENKKLYWQDIIDFYIVSIKLYEAAREKDITDKYRKLLAKKNAEVEEEGKSSSSYYMSR